MAPLTPLALSFAIAGAVLLGLWAYYAAALVAETQPRAWPSTLVSVGTVAFAAFGSYLFAADIGRRAGTIALALLVVTVAAGARRGRRRRRR